MGIRSIVERLFGERGGAFATDDRRMLLARMPRHGICAEIGVWKGKFSRRILEITQPRELHLIDPWAFQAEFPDRMYGGKVAKEQADMDGIYQQVAQDLGQHPGVTLHRGYSNTVLPNFPDGYFDWVYVDGNHYYEYVMTDLRLALQKVRPGGFITGDDYFWGEAEGFPVKKAVTEFAGANGFECEVIGSQFMMQRT